MRVIFSLLATAFLGLAVLTACNSLEKRMSNNPVSSGTTPAPVPADGVRRITVVELRDLLAKNEAVVIDVRNQDSYNLGHIRGAKLIPVGETLNRVAEFPRDKLIVTYCS